jgi:ferredoxin
MGRVTLNCFLLLCAASALVPNNPARPQTHVHKAVGFDDPQAADPAVVDKLNKLWGYAAPEAHAENDYGDGWGNVAAPSVDALAPEASEEGEADIWCDVEAPTEDCVDEDAFWGLTAPESVEDVEEDVWCDVEHEDARCVDADAFHGVEREPAWGEVDSHEAVALAEGRPEREAFAFVDERSCVGCNLCAAIAPATFFMEDTHGMARAYRQHGDADDIIGEAMASCPVDCIKSVTFEALKKLEVERRAQVINAAGRLTARAEGRAPRTIIVDGLVDTTDPAFLAREAKFARERALASRKALAGSKHRLVEL